MAEGAAGGPCLPSKMTVEELRDELRLRGEPTGGLKSVLVERLVAVLSVPGAQQTRLSVPGSGGSGSDGGGSSTSDRRRRNTNKKEPTRAEFTSEEEFQVAWTKWRESRDNNNQSVKRSRMMARKKREEQERIHREREQQNTELEKLVTDMKDEVRFLNKVLKTPELLDRGELSKLEDLLARGMPPLAVGAQGAAAAARGAAGSL